MLKKYLFTNFIFIFLLTAFSKPVLAVCPLCTIAVGAGLGVSRVIGIDDAVSGVWIGGLLISSGMWMGDFIQKKKWRIPRPVSLSIFLMYILVIPSLIWSGLIGLPGNVILGIDKILFGIILGSLVFVLSVLTDRFLRKKNNGEVYIYYQKVILPLLFLTLSSYLLHILVNIS